MGFFILPITIKIFRLNKIFRMNFKIFWSISEKYIWNEYILPIQWFCFLIYIHMYNITIFFYGFSDRGSENRRHFPGVCYICTGVVHVTCTWLSIIGIVNLKRLISCNFLVRKGKHNIHKYRNIVQSLHRKGFTTEN